MNLKNLKPSNTSKPMRYVIYGQEGVGKSTLASGSKNPLWLDIEDGAGNISAARIPFPDGHATDYSQVLEALDAVLEQEHDFTTLVVDTIDRLESLIWAHVCSKAGPKYRSIEDFGYGKGYVVALSCWRDFAAKLDRIRSKRNMVVILIAHSHIKKFLNPEGDDYDRFQLRLHDKASGFLKEWADCVAFMRFDEGASKLAGEQRAKGYNTGKRYAYTKRRAAFDAKCRFDLQEEIEIKGSESWGCLEMGRKRSTAKESNPF